MYQALETSSPIWQRMTHWHKLVALVAFVGGAVLYLSISSPHRHNLSEPMFAAAISTPAILSSRVSPTLTTSTRLRKSSRSIPARVGTVNAFFKKKAPEPEPEPEPVKRGFFSFGSKEAQPGQQVRDVEYVPAETMSDAYARVRKQRARTKAKFEAKEKGGLSLFVFNALSAVNFEEDIKADRGLLSAAKRMGKGDKMTREQYGALKRKVGGTKGGFFGENIFAKGEYLDKGYEVRAEEEPSQPLASGFLYAVLLAVLATTVYVFIQVGKAG